MSLGRRWLAWQGTQRPNPPPPRGVPELRRPVEAGLRPQVRRGCGSLLGTDSPEGTLLSLPLSH